MVSSLIGYQIYANNLTDSLARLQKSATVSRDMDYYNSHISKVSTVDAFLDDYRLYSYAMKAYGLEDQIASKGLIRQVLESDLTDSSSFANKLTDPKYKAFAAAFNFKTDAAPVAQAQSQTEAVVEAYSEATVRGGISAAAAQAYFEANIGSVKTVDDLLADPKLMQFATQAAGIDTSLYSNAFLKSWLTDNRTYDGTDATEDFAKLSAMFNFNQDGTLPTDKPAMNADTVSQTVHDYYVAKKLTGSAPYAANEEAYFKSKIGAVATTADLVTDDRLFNYVLTAYGFDPSIETKAYVNTVLAAGPAQTNSIISGLATDFSSDNYQADLVRKQKFINLVNAFNFTDSGNVDSTLGIQTADQQKATVDGYYGNYKTLPNKGDATQTSTFKTLLANINTVTDLLADKPVWGRDALNYVLRAFDIPPVESDLTVNRALPDGDRTSILKIRKVLQSDPSDPNSYVRKLKDPRFEKLAAAFNFGVDGKAQSQRQIQTASQQTATGTLYTKTFGTDLSEAKKSIVTADNKAYLTAVSGIRSLDDLLSNAKVLDYTLKAYGLDKADLSKDTIKKILTSDLSDPKSFANAAKDKKYVDFAKAFNFQPDGTVRIDSGGAQSGLSKLTTENNYLLQTLEEQAGDMNEGSRLALYFLRKAPDVKNSLDILADKALLQVVKTAYGLPDAFSNLDVDQQQKIIDSKVNVEDFQDPAKLDKFIKRYTGLYDTQNSTDTLANSPLIALFNPSGSGTYGILGLF